MRIATINVNGIRSAAKKGLFDWLKTADIDYICLQEVRARETDLAETQFVLPNYERYLFEANKKGYSGVAIYAKHQPLTIKRGLGFSLADEEGRYLELQFADFSLASLYLPSGTSGEERQLLKYSFLNQYSDYLKTLNKPMIICGDFNIAHQAIDLKNWRQNQKNSGFLPEERAWMDHLFDELNFCDVFRIMNTSSDQYTWWSNRGRAYENNVGWRIDYQVATAHFKNCIKSVSIYKEKRFSDHAPLIVEYSPFV